MAVMSVRMNREEEKMINYLSEYFEEEKSSIIKRSLIEMYENIVDRKVIDTFEKEKHTFVNAEDILREFVSPPLQLDNKDKL